jgi:hypothetical protein
LEKNDGQIELKTKKSSLLFDRKLHFCGSLIKPQTSSKMQFFFMHWKNLFAVALLSLGTSTASFTQALISEKNTEGLFETEQMGIFPTQGPGNIALRKNKRHIGWGTERLIIDWADGSTELFEGQPDVERVQGAAALDLPTGGTVVMAIVAGCDFGVPAAIIVYDANHEILWQTTMSVPLFSQCSVFLGEGNTFYAVAGYNYSKYSLAGGPALESGVTTSPFVGATHPSGAVVMRDNTLSLFSGSDIFIAPWDGTTAIRGLHTLANGNISVFDQEKWYVFNAQLQPVSVVDFAEEFEAVATCNSGFMSVVRVDTSLFLQRYSELGELSGIYDLGKHLYDPHLMVKNDSFYLGATLFPPDQSQSAWEISGTVDLVGQWAAPSLDVAITGIQFSGIPEATKFNTPYEEYSVDYSGVFAILENKGTETISSYHLKYREPACSFICPSDAQNSAFVELPIEPGESRIVYLGNIAHSCVAYDVRNLCIFITTINNRRETNTDNNIFCTFLPDIVSTVEASSLSIKTYPNPATETVIVELPDYLQATDYRIWDIDGRLVRMAQFTIPRIEVASLVAGNYRLELLLEGGQSAAASFVKK